MLVLKWLLCWWIFKRILLKVPYKLFLVFRRFWKFMHRMFRKFWSYQWLMLMQKWLLHWWRIRRILFVVPSKLFFVLKWRRDNVIWRLCLIMSWRAIAILRWKWYLKDLIILFFNSVCIFSSNHNYFCYNHCFPYLQK